MSSDPSVEFLEHHIDESFGALMKVYLIKDLYWLEVGNKEARAIAELSLPTERGLEDTNLIVLFPIYIEE
jgi:hypothetical protein